MAERKAENHAIVHCNADALSIEWGPNCQSTLPHLWLRDNCGCDDCRIAQTSEKKFFVANVSANIAPRSVEWLGDRLSIVWPDGHRSDFDGEALRAFEQHHGPTNLLADAPWTDNFLPSSCAYRTFLKDDRVAAEVIGRFLNDGAIILKDAPTSAGTLEQLTPRLGPIREVLFARIHDVQVDPGGYNVAHTSMPLPPHNDFASYTWPPSVQALHMLENETPGGESFIVDGWAVLNAIREERPRNFDALCALPVPFREFDDENETFAVEPIVRLDADGRVAGLRFSNQLMQAIDPNHPKATEFYRAYHELCCRITEPQFRSTFRLAGGEILILSAHRILHGREAFEASGRRHLQDAYFELDNVRNHRVVLQRSGVA